MRKKSTHDATHIVHEVVWAGGWECVLVRGGVRNLPTQHQQLPTPGSADSVMFFFFIVLLSSV